MQPLKKQRDAASAAEAQLTALVAACEPLAVGETRKRQSLVSIRDRINHAPTWRFTLRFGVVAAVLLMAGGAGAAFGVHRWKGERRAVAAPVTAAAAIQPLPRPAGRSRIADPPAEAPPPAIVRRASRARLARAPESPALVVAAIQALRQDREPARASRLLADYLRAYPRGALAEEAVALSIEAADARHSPAALAFAERYLRDYPQGRFHATAAQALARSPRARPAVDLDSIARDPD